MEENPYAPAEQPTSGLHGSLPSNLHINSENMQMIMDRLADAIDELPDNEQVIIGLHYIDQLNFKEIGLVLDLTESRVDQLYRRAMTRLRTGGACIVVACTTNGRSGVCKCQRGSL